ncbi:flagellar basal body-associated protein FliL [Helicobacter mustelae]|uniref:Flagellar protein FliL n=1 Tax=Helicobacter mustelae (strain ATCC 43772 / CCUG 25715 / CIP 103759 / LMG 18044 / NCTC 12198 / R85-136P) TaxID=679897 RepID=D3UIN4_HELM1|nr:flagellar basal body-associated protein FliL [Helicobacter mustelae]CBG40359.1 possible flagellar protein [Helicobacter mustelae 12198]SQH71858.1 flagellar protein [Helicobacter mustelae]STP12997.1 flagellar protein [Helicobacter mustelae]
MAEEAKQEKGKSKALLFVILGVVVFLIIVIALVVMLLMGGEKQEAKQEVPAASKTQAPGTKDTSLLSIGPLYSMPKPFIVNLVTQSGRRYLKTSITFELSNPKLQQEVEQKTSILQDIIIDVLSSKSIEEIVTTKGKERIKDEILQRVNQILVDGYMKNIFFTEFVVQ